jgi:hypothetical protein
MPATPDELTAAIAAWRTQAAALRLDGHATLAQICERCAQALEIERGTGIAVCTCCHKPFR